MGEIEKIRFSVVVPLYNKEQYIERTLQSILSQTYRDYEIIVIDDGSTDGSYSKVESILKQDSKSSIIFKQQNSGVGSARNKGVELSRGEYICFLDSDDWWEPKFLECIDGLISKYPNALMYGSSFYLVKNGTKRIAPIGVDKEFKEGYINYYQTYAKTLCMPISSSSVALSRKAFYEVGQFNTSLTLGEDFDLWIRLALKGPVALVNTPLSNYFQDIPVSQRATRKLHPPQQHMLWNLNKYSDYEKTNKDVKKLFDRLRASGLFGYYLSHKYHSEAMEQLKKIDWNNVPSSTYRLYHSSITIQRIIYKARRIGAQLKQKIRNL